MNTITLTPDPADAKRYLDRLVAMRKSADAAKSATLYNAKDAAVQTLEAAADIIGELITEVVALRSTVCWLAMELGGQKARLEDLTDDVIALAGDDGGDDPEDLASIKLGGSA